MFFVIILGIFVVAFGVTTHATMYPETEFSWDIFSSLINKAYWPIYGEMKILSEDIGGENCADDPSKCAQQSGATYSFVALMFYMIIANVLLVSF